jgi:hypothetical protein
LARRSHYRRMTACPGRRNAMNVEDRERLRTVVADAA